MIDDAAALSKIKALFPTLNDGQIEAIRTVDGPLQIIAGPGSGKTLVLVLRALYLLVTGRAQPSEILVTTFTEKAAFETLDSAATRRPAPRRYHPQHLCLDKGYDYPEIEAGVIERRYVPHMRHRGEIENPVKRYKPRLV